MSLRAPRSVNQEKVRGANHNNKQNKVNLEIITMAKKTFKGRPLLGGNLKGKALASKQPFNTTGSYLENLFGGN